MEAGREKEAKKLAAAIHTASALSKKAKDAKAEVAMKAEAALQTQKERCECCVPDRSLLWRAIRSHGLCNTCVHGGMSPRALCCGDASASVAAMEAEIREANEQSEREERQRIAAAEAERLAKLKAAEDAAASEARREEEEAERRRQEKVEAAEKAAAKQELLDQLPDPDQMKWDSLPCQVLVASGKPSGGCIRPLAPMLNACGIVGSD
jgi:hypothetical protein